MKEIELLKTIFKDSPDILEPLNEIDKEIERLEKEIKSHIEYNKHLQKEIVKANDIIKEVREYINRNTINSDFYKCFDGDIDYLLEILKGE